MNEQLPEGFTLDRQEPTPVLPPAQAGLPEGFKLDAQVPQQPLPEGFELDEAPSLGRYGLESAKAFGRGAVEGSVASPIRGLGAAVETAQSKADAAALELMQKVDRGEQVREADDPLGYLQMSPEQREATRLEIETRMRAPVRPVSENPIYKAGQAVTSAVTEGPLKEQPGVLHPVARDILQGAGSLGGNIATAMVPGVGLPLLAANAPLQGIGEAAERAVAAGATPEQQQRAAMLGTVPGATEFLDGLLPMAGTPGKAAGFLAKVGMKLATGAFIEGGQEGLQQLMQNAIAKGIYKPDQDITEDVVYNALIGAIVGGGAKLILPEHGHERPNLDNAPAELNVRQVYQDVVQPQPQPQQAEEPVIQEVEQPRPVTDLASRVAEDPVFFSQVKRTVEEKGPTFATAEQWLATIKNAPGVKAEEVEALGLPEYLTNKRGKISKADLVGFIEDNAITIEETTKAPKYDVDAEISGNEAKYESHTLPGGENYREVLLRLPEQKAKSVKPDAVAEVRPNGRGGFDIYNALDNSLWITQEGQGMTQQEAEDQAGMINIQRTLEAEVKADPNFRGGHWSEPNVLAHFRLKDRQDTEGKRVLFVEEIQRSRKADAKIPLFKTSWPELAFKRILRMAADEGYDRVAWTPGSAQARRYEGTTAAGQEFLYNLYDKVIPSIAQRWAKRLGARFGVTDVPLHTEPKLPGELPAPIGNLPVHFVEVTPEARTRIQQGLPMFSAVGPKGVTVDTKDVQADGSWANAQGVDLRPAVREAGRAIARLANQMGVREPITIRMIRNAGGRMLGQYYPEIRNGRTAFHVIEITPALHANALDAYATLSHEFGHLVQRVHWEQAPIHVKLAFELDYQKFLAQARNEQRLQDVLSIRDNHITNLHNTRQARGYPVMEQVASWVRMAPEVRQYWLSREEYFAEQVAKWMTTSQKPLNVIERFYKAIADKLREVYRTFASKLGTTIEPGAYTKEWLDSLVSQPPFMQDSMQRAERKSQQESESAMRSIGAPEFPAEPQQAATALPRQLASALGPLGPEAKASLAAADRFNKFYEKMLSLVQVAARNLHIAPLQRYRELWQVKQLERAQIMDEALRTLKAWRKLLPQQADNLSGLIDDYMNMRYLTPAEVSQGIVRRPTLDEFQKLVRDNKVDDRGIAVFQQVVQNFDRMLTRYKDLLVSEAKNITDPLAQARRMNEIDAQIAAYQKQPYFPAMRFGDFTLTIRNAAGKVVHFETFESKRKRASAEREIRGRLAPGEAIQLGFIRKEARPFLGLPSGLLDRIASKLSLSRDQQAALEELRFELAPAQSFKHRFQRKDRTPGYNTDFQRAFANYFFHGSNYLVNVKYVDALREQVKLTRESGRTLVDKTKRDQIANFMDDHLNYMLDPKADWAALRGLATLWFLGLNPASAALNLSQIPIMTFPFLASKFGDLRSAAAIVNAGARISTLYKRGRLARETAADMRALSEGVKQGVITEAMAPELAAISDGGVLKSWGGDKLHELPITIMEKAMWMFEMSEQYNRRVTFRAAWRLALAHPGSKYVRDSVSKHQIEWLRLRDSGWTDHEASAFVSAKDAVESTQFIYQQYAQPKFMRGKARTIFIFKTFIQNMLFTLWNYPTAAARSMLIMAYLGGLMGLPGMEDLRGLLKALAYRLFGKDFDLEEEVRKFALDVLNGVVPPDLLVHGMSRRGFGMPAALEALGVPFPTLDRSKAIGLGQISPVDVGALFGPTKDQARVMADTGQRATGAAFGMIFNMYKALTDGQLDANDFKRWEKAMPRFAANLSRSYRAFSEGGERNRRGNMVVGFDTTDPRQMMEVLAMGMGYQPLRLSAKWDYLMAAKEATDFWDIRREGLLRTAWTARQSGDEENWTRAQAAIRKFNADLPEEARGKAITSDVLRKSFTTRAQAKQSQEAGVPRRKADIPLVQEIQRLYPEAEVDVRRVK